MLAVLADYPDPQVDRAAIAIVEALLERDTTAYWLPDLLALLLPRLGDPDPVQRLSVLGEPREAASIETVRASGARRDSSSASPRCHRPLSR
ncbi:MAG: hypothetical protein HC897_02435 [Thermoanaerobaculia bacterium]|nr:hypothetical protein [Thermoanaerobaculia bacterium]